MAGLRQPGLPLGSGRRGRPALFVTIPEQSQKTKVCIAQCNLDLSAKYSPAGDGPFVTLAAPEEATEPAEDTLYPCEAVHAPSHAEESNTVLQPDRRETVRSFEDGATESSHSISVRRSLSSSASLNKPLPRMPHEEPAQNEELLPGPSRPVTVVHTAPSVSEAKLKIEHGVEGQDLYSASPISVRMVEKSLHVAKPPIARQVEDGIEVVPKEDDESPPSPMGATLNRPFSSLEPVAFWSEEDDDDEDDDIGESLSESMYAESACSSVDPPGSCSTGRTSPDEPPPVPQRSHKRPMLIISRHSRSSSIASEAASPAESVESLSGFPVPPSEEIKPLRLGIPAKAAPPVVEQKALVHDMPAVFIKSRKSETTTTTTNDCKPIDDIPLRRSIYSEMIQQLPPALDREDFRQSHNGSDTVEGVDAITALLSSLQSAQPEEATLPAASSGGASKTTINLASINTALDEIRISLTRQYNFRAAFEDCEGGAAVANASIGRDREVDTLV